METPVRVIPPRRWPLRLAWLLLTIYFLTPAREAFDQSLDKSNYATYAHFISHHFQWGKDVIPMTGPFGFILYGHTYTGELFGVRLVGELLLKAAFVALLLHLFRRAAPGPVRWIWLTGVILLVPTVDDLFHDYAILVAVLVLLANLERLNRPAWLAAALLGALALFKGTQLLTTAACFGSVVLLAVLERRWRALAVLTGVYFASVAGWWLIAGQNPAYLPVYLKGVLELSSGYNASMGLPETPLIQTAGLALATGLALNFIWVAAHSARSLRLGIVLLLLAGFSFIKWKHGYLRADGHVFIFFASTAVITLTLWLAARTPVFVPPPPPATPGRRRLGLALAVAVTGFAVVGCAEFWLWRVYRIAADAPVALLRNLRFVARPGFFRVPLDTQLEHNRREAQVPQIQNTIGRGTVDFFGFEQGLLLLNGLHYHPRPMGGGSFNVFTPWLQEKNEAFVRDPSRAPAWQVLKLQTLDDRLPAADDPLTLRAILQRYSPVLMERDYLLLRRRTGPDEAPAPALLATHQVQSGEDLAVPDPGPGRMLLFSVKAPLSVGGTIRSFLYRPPELQARLYSRLHPHGRAFALKPPMVRRPVILSPLLLDNLDVIQLFGNAPGNPVRSLRLEAGPGFDAAGFTVSFYAAPRPPPPEDCDIGEIITYVQHPLHNRTPLDLATEPTGIRELNKEPITLVHAPGRISWPLLPGDQQVIFSYGLMPQTYLDGGTTDGVEFIIEALPAGGDALPVFRRFLQPVTRPEDRGMQRARVYLPPNLPAGSVLRLRTEPGPAGNGAWDQSYVTRLQIKQGLPDPRQYFGFNATPLPPGFAAGSEFELDGRPVRGVHPPFELAFALPAGARRVVAGIGLMPGAYQGENKTDGVEFTFAIRHADGRTETLGRRRLDPLHQPGDRGIQALEFSLPLLPEGSVLLLRTGPGPRDNFAWDWAVLQTLIIE